jgi:hypothetical protein
VCHYTFVVGEGRHTSETDLTKALRVLLYSLGKAALGCRAKLFGVSRTTTDYGLRAMAATTEEPRIAGDLPAIDCDALWPFVPSKQSSAGSSQPWSMGQGARLPGYAVVVRLQRSNAWRTK